MGHIGRSYNALTGAELKKIVLSEVEKALDESGINSPAVTYPMAAWNWNLTISQKEADTPERKVEAGNVTQKEIESDRLDGARKMAAELAGGSKRFAHNPPSPTEVRTAQKLPLPEA